ncbi:hypothetical protein HHL16_24055 [Pseudoflavitalea sp. G-6-1-2]|uniref:hypothetical protein n=1 Tax=Pseudoflavitalea sp. G-6-1-2 TaxID=2728841 RepID=UPI00146A8FEA|nr:hypothetical protein [Pseudoflavitalea sp. G-6-1-2]NML23977.1 hypothetical protein [Pseudoflavitalea sp. G-6-1-2]
MSLTSNNKGKNDKKGKKNSTGMQSANGSKFISKPGGKLGGGFSKKITKTGGTRGS